MPKSNKQKKEKASDFKKKKLKLGKGKQQATNATNTSFTAKAIILPDQSIGVDHAGEPVTRRNQTIDDLLTNLKHYNVGIRKDAIHGLKEILSTYPDLLRSHVGSVTVGVARLIPDDDAGVRKSIRLFLGWYLPTCPKDVIAPFYSLLLFYTTSALSHIFPEIRIDATYVVDILLDLAPEVTCSGCFPQLVNKEKLRIESDEEHGPRILTAYLTLLGIGDHIMSSISSNSQLIVLKSLHRLLSTIVSMVLQQPSTSTQTVPTWFYGPCFKHPSYLAALLATIPNCNNSNTSQELGRMGEPILQVDRAGWNQGTSTCHVFEPFDLAFSTAQAMNATSSFANNKPTQDDQTKQYTLSEFLHLILPFLLNTFLESSPSAFDPWTSSTSEHSSKSLEIIWSVSMLTRDLWRLFASTISSSTTQHDQNGGKMWNDCKGEVVSLLTFVNVMSRYFVFGKDELEKRDAQSMSRLQDLNLCYCELLSLLAFAAHEAKLPSPKPTRPLLKVDALSSYVEELLTSNNNRSRDISTPAMTAPMFCDLLPTIWSLLCHSNLASSTFSQLLDHFSNLRASSQVKSISFSFLARLSLMEDFDGCTFPLGRQVFDSQQSALEAWFKSLFKYVWELGSSHLQTTQCVLAFLHRATSKPLLRFAPLMSDLAPLLIPFFVIRRPKGIFTLGPYSRLPKSLKDQALAIAYFIVSEQGVNSEALRDAVAQVTCPKLSI